MFEALGKHPEIFINPGVKEPHFFGKDLHHVGRTKFFTHDEYLALFAEAGDAKRVVEGSTSYFYSKSAPQEIKDFSPSASIMIMLRNPVDMMYSWHSYNVYLGHETYADFEAALAAEDMRKQGKALPTTPVLVEGLFYREVASYTPHLQRYFETFGRERVHVVIFDDFAADPAGAYRATLDFLGVNPHFRAAIGETNAGRAVRSRALQRLLLTLPSFLGPLPRVKRLRFAWQRLSERVRRLNSRPVRRASMDPALRRRLQAEFRPEVERLSELLGRDLTHWCNS